MNASDERKLESIRTKVKQFARTAPIEDFVQGYFLDEADALTSDAESCPKENNGAICGDLQVHTLL